MNCSAKGNTKPQYRWMKDGRFVSNWDDLGDYVIESATEDDQGGYACLASSSAGLIQSSVAYMTVHGKMESDFFVHCLLSQFPLNEQGEVPRKPRLLIKSHIRLSVLYLLLHYPSFTKI